MTNRKFLAIRNLGLVFVAALSVVAAAQAGEAAPAAAAAESSEKSAEVIELDEVLVRGKALVRAISDAEDEFYALYNKLNTDDQYTTRCTNLNIDPDNVGSLLTSRVCIPGFVADAMADHAEWKARCEPEFSTFDGNRDGRISTYEADVNVELSQQFKDLDKNENNALSIDEFRPFELQTAMNSNCYRPPPPQLVLMEGSDAWYKHMMKITQSDPRLQKMAGHLDDLYREWSEVQRKYTAVKKADDAPATTRRELGPRMH